MTKTMYKNAVSTRNAFDESIKIEDDPDVEFFVENVIPNEMDDISNMTLTDEDTSEKTLPSEKIPARNYKEKKNVVVLV